MAHEILVDLFTNRPVMAAEILVEVFGVVLPAYTEARVASIDLTETQPAVYQADVVILLLHEGTPVWVIVVEVQLKKDKDKPFTWPTCLTVSRKEHRCPAELLVVAPKPAVADWCAKPIAVGPAGFVLHPNVLRREGIPVVTDPAEAARRLELAMAHGETEQGAPIAAAALPAIHGLEDEERARFYADIVYNALNDAARLALENLMKGYEYQSDFAKKYEANARARDVLAVLRVRGVAVPDVARERILAEKDPVQLERWLEKAVNATTLAEVLDEPS